ncbi:hypothetical protein MRX96_055751 [Rhipicephalus microplus]
MCRPHSLECRSSGRLRPFVRRSEDDHRRAKLQWARTGALSSGKEVVGSLVQAARSDNAEAGNRMGTRTHGDCGVHVSSSAAASCSDVLRTSTDLSAHAEREEARGSFFACRRITRMPSFSHAALFFPEGGSLSS